MSAIDVIIRKLSPICRSLLRKGKIKTVILMSSTLSASDKALLLKYYGDK